MKKTKYLIESAILKQGLSYIRNNPEKNLIKILNWVEKLDKDKLYAASYKGVREALEDPENIWNKYIMDIVTGLDKKVLEKLFVNFVLNSGVLGTALREENKIKYDCNIPWAILMDPTSACNLKCTGCWAAEYDKSASMDIELLDSIISQGKELGTYFYIYSGGEPLVRRDDIIKLCKKHDDCIFLSFTNGTLIDEEFADKIKEVANFIPAISIEGFEDTTDLRRGNGTYAKAVHAMDILKSRGLPFGFSTCYHNKNVETVGSEEYIDFMLEKGARFGWFFTYMPVGHGAVLDLLTTPEQREFMYHRIREFRSTKPLFTLDFWNDGDYVDGCIAGGRNYLHINANGDVEPCAFIHYSNVNIKDVTLLEALHSPIFMEYKKNQPFNHNHYRPCPLLDNPHKLSMMVHNSGAKSTEMLHPEDVDELTAKCKDISEKWAVNAEKLWEEKNS